MEGLPLRGGGLGGFLGGRAQGFVKFRGGFLKRTGFSFCAFRAPALCARARAAALCLVDLNFACGLRLCRFSRPLHLGLLLSALLAAGRATWLVYRGRGNEFVLVGWL